MDKFQAEQIMELHCPYTAVDLRSAYSRLANLYHPDTAPYSGMDADIAAEYMSEINIACQVLKKQFTDGVIQVEPAANPAIDDVSQNATDIEQPEWVKAFSEQSAKADASINNANSAGKAQQEQNNTGWLKTKINRQRAQLSEHGLIYRFFARFPYRVVLFAIIIIGFFYLFGGLNLFPDMPGIYASEEIPGWLFMLYIIIIGPLATINLVFPIITAPLRKAILKIISKLERTKS